MNTMDLRILLATGYKSKILENYFKHKKMLDVYLLAIKL